MTTTAIRHELITYLADADDKKLKALYNLLESDIKERASFTLSDTHIKILDEERAKHLSGKTKSYSRVEAMQIVRGKKMF